MFKKEPNIPKTLIGKRFTESGATWELTGHNRLNVPYFSKVVRGKTQKKQFTHTSGLKQVEKWKKQEIKKFKKEHSTHIPKSKKKKLRKRASGDNRIFTHKGKSVEFKYQYGVKGKTVSGKAMAKIRLKEAKKDYKSDGSYVRTITRKDGTHELFTYKEKKKK